MTYVHQCSKVYFRLSLCASRTTSFLLLNFSSCHAGFVSSFFPFPARCSFYVRNLHCLRHGNKFVNQIVVDHRSATFACNAIIVFCRQRRFHSLPCGFMRFHFFNHKSFFEICWDAIPALQPLCGAGLSVPFEKHCWCQRPFQCYPRIFESFFVILVIPDQ